MFDQYHEPPNELPEATRTFARMIAGLIEEAEAIGWYEQRLSVEKDKDARAIMRDAQKEEFKHFSMDLEFLLRKKKQWREIAEGVLFKPGNIVEHGEEAEEETERLRHDDGRLPERDQVREQAIRARDAGRQLAEEHEAGVREVALAHLRDQQ